MRDASSRTHLFTVLVGDDVALGRTGICTQNNATFEEAPYDRCSCAGSLG